MKIYILMKKVIYSIYVLCLFGMLFSACEKDMDKAVLVQPASIKGFAASALDVVLNAENKEQTVVTFKLEKPEYGLSVIPSYSLQFDVPSDTTGENAWSKAVVVRLNGNALERSFSGADLNAILVTQLEMKPGQKSSVAVRLVSEILKTTGTSSTVTPVYSTITMMVTPFEDIVIYPALVVKGGNSWLTPPVAERTPGYVLTSAGFNSKYEGYLDLPNADGWGGDAFTLVSSTDQKVYGWGTSATTLAENGGNLWLTPSPAYMKVNVDLSARTISYTAVNFSIAGDHNNWSTTETPMTYDAASGVLKASGVSLTAGKAFAFIANNGWDINYKVDGDGKLMFAGAPSWGGNNITVPSSGTYTVVLDLSKGAGNYTYSLIKE